MNVKICCIASVEEAMMAINAGATAIGLVGPMPSGPGVIPDETIAEIAAAIPSHIDSFLLTSETSVENIIAHHQKVKTTTIQIVDTLKEGSYRDLKIALKDVKIVQVIHVQDQWALEEASKIAPQVDYLLLDSGKPQAKTKILGGTGNTHDWGISRMIVEMVKIPVFLAGGLKPENIAEAIDQVNPYGVDLCSGVRTNGKLDPYKLESFFASIGHK